VSMPNRLRGYLPRGNLLASRGIRVTGSKKPWAIEAVTLCRALRPCVLEHWPMHVSRLRILLQKMLAQGHNSVVTASL
jgi:hypothetical protein